jgi:GT2 family glycosyltransferase
VVSVAIATADRPEHVRRAVESVLSAGPAVREVIVVDQSPDERTRLALAELAGRGVSYVHQSSRGASKARNTAARGATGEYVAFLDDDVEVPPTWGDAVRSELERLDWPDALYGAIRAPGAPTERAALAVSTFEVDRTRVWVAPVPPSRLGYSGHMIVRRSSFLGLEGFDERLGPGTPLHGAEDMDLNYRLLRAGLRAATTPAVWLVHHQWRRQEDIPRLLSRYNLGHSAFCAKHLLAGDRYPWRLLAIQVAGDGRMLASSLRRRSWLRARTAAWRTAGTWQGLVRGWRTFSR